MREGKGRSKRGSLEWKGWRKEEKECQKRLGKKKMPEGKGEIVDRKEEGREKNEKCNNR